MMSFGNTHRETMKGSNERVNYIPMNGIFSFFCPTVGGRAEERENLCNALISFSDLCVDVRKACSPKTVCPTIAESSN